MNRLLRYSLGSLACLLAAGLCFCCATASAQITGISTTDNSSAAGSQIFLHQTSVSPVTTSGNTAEFVHTAQLLNEAMYSGGAAQVNARNSSFQLAFTVEDPNNAGFTVEIDQLLRGYSQVSVTSGRGDATGVSYFVQAGDSTDAPGTLSNRVDLFIGTDGVTVNLGPSDPPATARELFESTDSDVFGSYVGATDFVLDYTTFFSPTTNVFFQNNSVGSGAVNYGLGVLLANDPLNQSQLGHFLTVRTTFNIPEPNSALLLALVSLGTVARRAK